MSAPLYYRRGEDWIRVNADSYTQALGPGSGFLGGQCVGIRYRIVVSYDNYLRGTFSKRDTRILSSSYLGKIQGVRIDYSSVTSQIIVLHDNRETRADYESTSNTQWYNIRIESVTRLAGLPDDCGNGPDYVPGGCVTTFTLNGSTVLTLNSCPEVTNGNECRHCCKELLPIARRIDV